MKPKLVMHSGSVGPAARHLSQEELDAYMNGRLPAARLHSCSNHLDSCDACRAELEDLRTFKNGAAGLSQSGSLGRELDRRKRQRQLRAAGGAAMVAAVVAAIAAVGWWQFEKTRAQRTSVTATAAVAATATVQPQVTTQAVGQPHGVGVVAAVAQASASANGAAATPSPDAAASRRVASQAASNRATRPAPAASGAPGVPAVSSASTFTLLGPFGDEIADARPEFTWQPLAGATKYSVVIVDEGLRPVQHSHGVKITSWRPRRPLRRGRTYLWQVTATLRNGTKIVAMSPTSMEARIHITQMPSGKLADN